MAVTDGTERNASPQGGSEPLRAAERAAFGEVSAAGPAREPTAPDATRAAAGSPDRAMFVQHADEQPPTLIAELCDFIRHEKKWWLTPIIIILLLAALFVFLQSTALGPFLYPGL
ncbi:MAG: hypothetical protein D6725_04480 [Planctomycetota bacterium]|nr:MAG: hypothetical protein D6725_04480 [Planctomycetota bacterium]